MSKDSNLGVAATRGALMGSSGQIIKLVINLASLILLSRILSPEDYGLTALAFAMIGVAEIVRDMGLSTASIQAKELSTAERNNLWWANSALGLICTLICWALAPLIASIYDDSRLILVILLMSTVFTFSGMATQYRVSFMRKLQYGRLASWEVLCSVIAFFSALIIALTGGGYWALIAQQIINNLLVFLGLTAMAGWLPGKYNRQVSIKKFFSFGLPLVGSSAISYASSNLDSILIGKYFGLAPLGSYSRATQMVRLPMNQLRSPLVNIVLSTVTKVRDNPVQYQSTVLKAQALYLYPIVFLAVWIALGSDDIIHLLLGEKWYQSASLVAILALGDAITSLSNAASWIYLAEAKSAALFRLTLFTTLLRIGLFLLAIPFGVEAVAGVYAVTSAILWPLTYIHCSKTTSFKTLPMFMVSLRVFIVVGLAATATYAVASLDFAQANHLIHLLVLTLTQVLAFILCALLIKPTRKELAIMATMLRKLIKR